MSSELQERVDDLGSRFSRSVAVDDPELRLLAYNSHPTAVDEQRMVSILQRRVPEEVVAHSYRLGCGEARDVFTEPPCPELGSTIARIGMPIRHRDVLLGFIWLMRSDGPLTDELADALREAAGAIAVTLHRQSLQEESADRRERELVDGLLSDDAQTRTDAAARAAEDGLLPPGTVTALTVQLERVDGESGRGGCDDDRDAYGDGRRPAAEDGRTALSRALDRLRRELPPPHAVLAMERGDHGAIIVSQAAQARAARARAAQTGAGTGSVQPLPVDVAELGSRLHERVIANTGRDSDSCRGCWVGIGEPRDAVADVHESYAEARLAARAGQHSRAFGNTVRYGRLGVYALLAGLPAEILRRGIPTGLLRLLESGSRGEALVATLEAFLDNAGNVKRTAEELCIQRATLYYRLRRIEEIAGADLGNGADRLALHTGLKAARMTALR